MEQFTAQLNTLQLARRHEYDPKSTQEGGRRCSDGCSVPLVWEAICEKQIARRIDAETENFRLKRTIEERADVIKRLQRAIKKSLKLVVRVGATPLVYTNLQTNMAPAAPFPV